MGKDNTGNIYLTGTIYENTGNADIFLMKIVSKLNRAGMQKLLE